MNPTISKTFHTYTDAEFVRYNPPRETVTKQTKHFIIQEREVSYVFYPHFHPYTVQLVNRLIEKSVSGLQAADTDYLTNPDGSFVTLPDGKNKPVLYADIFSPARYNPSTIVQLPYPVKDLDFTSAG